MHTVYDKLTAAGLRPTRQRLMLGEILFSGAHRHVTAESLHREACESQGAVSLATVYNTLHQFKEAKLLQEVSVTDGASYFDTNTASHHHFYHVQSGELTDIPGTEVDVSRIPIPPAGTAIRRVDVIIRVESAAKAAA